jgi:hypothetical protein
MPFFPFLNSFTAGLRFAIFLSFSLLCLAMSFVSDRITVGRRLATPFRT